MQKIFLLCLIKIILITACNPSRKVEDSDGAATAAADSLKQLAYDDSVRMRRQMETDLQEKRAIRKKAGEGDKSLIKP